jgi:very-short-patch-repair endonuclease
MAIDLEERENARWGALIRVQSMAFTGQQAQQYGIPGHRVRAHVAAQRWQRVYPRVYAAYNGPLTAETRLWAALLYAGPEAVLCRESAAYQWGLVDHPPQVIHVLVTGSTKLMAADGVHIHRTRRTLTSMDVYRSDGPPRTSAERTVLDLAEQQSDREAVCELVARAVRVHATTGERLTRALELRRHARYRALLRECCVLAAEGAHSVLEMRHARLCRRHGLPEPARQVPFRGESGWYRFDGFYEREQLVVELDGWKFHGDQKAWSDGQLRDFDLKTAHLEVLHLPGSVVLANPCEAARRQAAALRMRGWPGALRPCRLCS